MAAFHGHPPVVQAILDRILRIAIDERHFASTGQLRMTDQERHQKEVNWMKVYEEFVQLADKSGKTVTMTLWSGLATDQGARLEALTHPVVAFQGIRVSVFNGISLSTLSRTRFELEPETPEAAELRQWWAAEGATADLKHAGEGLASAQKAGGRDTSRKTLADLQPEELPA